MAGSHPGAERKGASTGPQRRTERLPLQPLGPEDARGDEKRRVALSSLLAAIVLTATKLVVGLSTNSLGILSEAAHSGLDLAAAAMTLWAVRASARPADREHPYGHGKIENLSALFETALLLATCAWILKESLARLAGGAHAAVRADVWSFGVMVLSIVVDVSRSRALARAAERHRSQALEADALHFSTDIWSSCVVIVGLVGVVAAKYSGRLWLEKADALAALGVAAIVVVVSIRLGRRAIDDLLDSVPHDLAPRVRDAARVEGVIDVGRVRVRPSGPGYFVDLTVTVARDADVVRAHEIATAVEDAVRRTLPEADVVVHAEPVDQ